MDLNELLKTQSIDLIGAISITRTATILPWLTESEDGTYDSFLDKHLFETSHHFEAVTKIMFFCYLFFCKIMLTFTVCTGISPLRLICHSEQEEISTLTNL